MKLSLQSPNMIRLSLAVLVALTALHAQNWYKGNTHLHSSWSDGSGTPEANMDWYRDRGYDWCVLTDHTHCSGEYCKTYVADVEGKTTDAFVAVNGAELSKGSHVCAIGLDTTVLSSSLEGGLQDNINEANAHGAIPVIAHPKFSGLSAADILQNGKNCAHIEIANWTAIRLLGSEKLEETIAYNEAIWDSILSTGRVMYGVACDDGHGVIHNPARGGHGFVVVRADTLTRDAVLDALKSGHFYASMEPLDLQTKGIVLNDYRIDHQAKAISIVSANGEEITFIGKNGTELETVAGDRGTYQIKGDELYVRARITNSSGQKGWTQPFLVADIVAGRGRADFRSTAAVGCSFHVQTSATRTIFRIHLSAPSDLSVRVFDIAGRKVWSCSQPRSLAGSRIAFWHRRDGDLSRVADGPYLAVLNAGSFRSSRMFVLR